MAKTLLVSIHLDDRGFHAFGKHSSSWTSVLYVNIASHTRKAVGENVRGDAKSSWLHC